MNQIGRIICYGSCWAPADRWHLAKHHGISLAEIAQETSEKYYSVATRLYENSTDGARNLLSLMASSDLEQWEVLCDLIDYRQNDPMKIGFQYVDFLFYANKRTGIFYRI